MLKNYRFQRYNFFTIIIILTFVLLCSNVTFATNRIISLIPSSTELIFAIGCGADVVAVSNYCNFPEEEIKNLPRIGDQNLNVEKILSLKPTILVDMNSIHKRYEEIFKKLKLNYVNINVKSQEDIPLAALELADLLGEKEKAKTFIESWKKELLELTKIDETNKPKIYMEIWNNPIQAAGSGNNIDSIVKTAGGLNALANKNDYPIVNSEMILLANPDIIILMYPEADIESVINRPGWKSIKAVKKGNIFTTNQDLFVRPGPRNLDAIRIVNNIIKKVLKNEENK